MKCGLIVIAANGYLAISSFTDLSASPTSTPITLRKSSRALRGKVVHLSLTRNIRTGQSIVVGGGDDGSVALFDAR